MRQQQRQSFSAAATIGSGGAQLQPSARQQQGEPSSHPVDLAAVLRGEVLEVESSPGAAAGEGHAAALTSVNGRLGPTAAAAAAAPPGAGGGTTGTRSSSAAPGSSSRGGGAGVRGAAAAPLPPSSSSGGGRGSISGGSTGGSTRASGEPNILYPNHS